MYADDFGFYPLTSTGLNGKSAGGWKHTWYDAIEIYAGLRGNASVRNGTATDGDLYRMRWFLCPEGSRQPIGGLKFTRFGSGNRIETTISKSGRFAVLQYNSVGSLARPLSSKLPDTIPGLGLGSSENRPVGKSSAHNRAYSTAPSDILKPVRMIGFGDGLFGFRIM